MAITKKSLLGKSPSKSTKSTPSSIPAASSSKLATAKLAKNVTTAKLAKNLNTAKLAKMTYAKATFAKATLQTGKVFN